MSQENHSQQTQHNLNVQRSAKYVGQLASWSLHIAILNAHFMSLTRRYTDQVLLVEARRLKPLQSALNTVLQSDPIALYESSLGSNKMHDHRERD